MQIQAKIIADSICGNRITTFLVVAPRIILAEINTHRVLSKNAASSRAIPVARRIEQVCSEPFTPTFWGANQPGMQADESVQEGTILLAQRQWDKAARESAYRAGMLSNLNIHKSIANRILEPFTWVSQLLTGTEWANFFNLRVSEGAQDEFHELAGQMLRCYVASVPDQLQPGDWHIPFADRMGEWGVAGQLFGVDASLKIAAARCARLSYERHEGGPGGVSDVAWAEEKLLAPGHMSPFEHSAQAQNMALNISYITSQRLREIGATWDGSSLWWGNLRGWKQYRKTLPNENRTEMDAHALLADWAARRAERGYAPLEPVVARG